jgi:hypothetical protein
MAELVAGSGCWPERLVSSRCVLGLVAKIETRMEQIRRRGTLLGRLFLPYALHLQVLKGTCSKIGVHFL